MESITSENLYRFSVFVLRITCIKAADGAVLCGCRTVAACRISGNVKEGDIITISFGNKEVKVEVLDVQETVRKEEAKELFRYL